MKKRLLITDVDNTLFDWQEVWYQTFSAMIKQVILISGVNEERLYYECSLVHQRYGTSEYSQVLGELPCLREIYGGKIYEHMAPAIQEYRNVRQRVLSLYPGVREALERLLKESILVAAFTESKAYYTNYRFRKLGLDGLISYIYSPRDHELSPDVTVNRRYEPSHYELNHTIHRFIPDGEIKPNPHILKTIVDELGFGNEESVYLGDNLFKDVYMAQQAGITDVYAAYGASQHRPEYELLRKVTHWTPEMVERERAALKPGAIMPTHTLALGFEEILPLFEVAQ